MEQKLKLFTYDAGPSWQIIAGTSRTDALKRNGYLHSKLGRVRVATQAEIDEWEARFGSHQSFL